VASTSAIPSFQQNAQFGDIDESMRDKIENNINKMQNISKCHVAIQILAFVNPRSQIVFLTWENPRRICPLDRRIQNILMIVSTQEIDFPQNGAWSP